MPNRMNRPLVSSLSVRLPARRERQRHSLAKQCLRCPHQRFNWSNLLSSIQTDEARHAQQGFPTLQVLMEHDPERAQTAMDVAFWRSTRLFQFITGTAMDYYTPLAQRKMSFKEFMLEWVVNH